MATPTNPAAATALAKSHALPPSLAATAASRKLVAEARQLASRSIATEDERRMRFLALLCGKGAFDTTTGGGAGGSAGDAVAPGGGSAGKFPGALPRQRDRGISVGGMGDIDRKGPRTGDAPATTPGKGAGRAAGAMTPTTTAAGGKGESSSSAPTAPQPNYQPTTPAALARRRLHTSGAGYLDPSLPLLLSAMSDRFLATVLVQAMACRDRRMEGHKASLRERRRRERHRRRAARERQIRERRFALEVERKRLGAEAAVKAAEGIEKKGGKVNAGSAGAVHGLTEKEKAAAAEYKKQHEGIDAEEAYYDNYYGEGDVEDDDDVASDDDDEEDELPDDPSLYDLKLRDVVRPLAAWGFDLSGKLGFDDAAGNENERDDDDDVPDAAPAGDAEEEGSDDDESEDDDDAGTDDEGTKKKKAPSPKKKKKAATGTKKKATTKKGTTTTSKRKRDEADEKKKGEPQAKKAATAGKGAAAKEAPKAVAAKGGGKAAPAAGAGATKSEKGTVVHC